jgi:CheY-like chemotaxis protein
MIFEVKDSGIGMTPEQIKKIFVPFIQAESGTTRNYGGTGLGLPIAKNLVELMGGILSVESALGIGSNFKFDLIFDTVEDAAYLKKAKSNIYEYETPYFQGDVLVCEDNVLNQQVIRSHLARVGLNAVIANDGKEGVDLVNARIENNEPPFSLIFMDIHMPVMDGIEAASIITKLDTGAPIVALTADLMYTDTKQYVASGIFDIIGKPFTSQELYDCLFKHIAVKSVVPVKNKTARTKDKLSKKKLQRYFVSKNQTTFEEISKAMDAGNKKDAHLIAHSLRSSAGQIGEEKLQAAAKSIEEKLSKGLPLLDEMNTLKTELRLTLERLTFILSEEPEENAVPLEPDELHELLNMLEHLLKSKDTACLNIAEKLRATPQTEELITQIESFSFAKALIELELLRDKI